MSYTPPSVFIETKKERIARCTLQHCGENGRYMCGRCRRMGQKLCRRYHNISLEVEKAYEKDATIPIEVSKLAAMEIEARLLYEFVFNFIDEDDLYEGKWMSLGLRDYGHTQRMLKLYRLFIHGFDVVPKYHKWMICNDV
jgi:hypothetical protein